MIIQRFTTSIKREYWEYKRSFLLLPLTLTILILIGILWAGTNISTYDINYEHIDSMHSTTSWSLNNDDGHKVLSINNEGPSQSLNSTTFSFKMTYTMMLIFIGLSCFVSMYYALGTLYNDRLDRSILFWKSMPLSETQNVLTKLLVALFLIPLIFIGFAISISLFAQLFCWVLAFVTDQQAAYALFNIHSLFLAILQALTKWSVLTVLMLPIIAWLLFASAASPRAPFLFASLLPILFSTLESAVLKSHYFSNYLHDLTSQMEHIWHMNFSVSVMETRHLWDVVVSRETCIGIVASMGLLMAAIWFRNHRFTV